MIPDAWPLEINLGIPAEQDALRHPDGARAWIAAWKNWQGSDQISVKKKSAGSLVWSERRWRTLGTQSVPERLILRCPNDVAVWIGEAARWSRAVERFGLLIQRWPALVDTLPGYFSVLADYNDSDFLSLTRIVSWIHINPNSNLYIRQIPVAGVDSKWLESRKSLVCDLVAAINQPEIPGDQAKNNDFFQRCGFKPPPQLIRIRLLDPNLKISFNGLSDISAPLEEIAALTITPSIVFIVENIQTAFAFNDLKNSVIIMGLGYGVDVLGKIPWLQNARRVYWGDIDTHGIAILNRARSYLPCLETVLMDEATLLSHRELWVEEKTQHASIELPLLTSSEQTLFQSLKNNVWGQRIRLEQERIRWDEAWNTIQKLVQ